MFAAQASKHQLARCAALPGGLALVAGSGVALVDTEGGSRVHKFTGHANPVAAVAATPDGRFLATAAEGERSVAVWNASPSKSGAWLLLRRRCCSQRRLAAGGLCSRF